MPATPPPADSQPPAWLLDRLATHADDSYIADHGFPAESLRLDWWQVELDRVKPWPPNRFKVGVDPTDRGAKKLTRADLFDLAGNASSDDEILNVLWHVLIWGSGRFVRNNRRRIAAFAHPHDERQNVNLLREAAQAARHGDVRTAYAVLIRPGGAVISGLGPAFFTKFLYFNSDRRGGRVCPILDARVARALYDPSVGWDIHPSSRKNANRTAFTANWYTDTYVYYCDLLRTWTQVAGTRLGRSVAVDEIEFALFTGVSQT